MLFSSVLLLPVLSFISISAYPMPTVPQSLPVVSRVHATVDTGAAATPRPTVLSPASVTSYAAVEKALADYWASHPDQEGDAQAHGQIHTARYRVFPDTNLSLGMTVPDYAMLAQHDTAIAALFTEHHFAPAQFEPTAVAVREAIMGALNHQKADSSSVIGKNIATVQAHQSELDDDWKECKDQLMVSNMIRSKMSQQHH